MADVTTIFVAAFSGLAGIAGGYLNGRHQRDVTAAQLEAERWKTDDQRNYEALERRLQNYREFLDVERELRVLVASSTEFAHSDFEAWLARFNRAHNLLVLTGSSEVRTEAGALLAEIGAMERERMRDPGDDSFASKLRRAYANRQESVTRVRDRLIEAMRADVEPGSAAA